MSIADSPLSGSALVSTRLDHQPVSLLLPRHAHLPFGRRCTVPSMPLILRRHLRSTSVRSTCQADQLLIPQYLLSPCVSTNRFPYSPQPIPYKTLPSKTRWHTRASARERRVQPISRSTRGPVLCQDLHSFFGLVASSEREPAKYNQLVPLHEVSGTRPRHLFASAVGHIVLGKFRNCTPLEGRIPGIAVKEREKVVEKNVRPRAGGAC
ncbi:hypothetical protein C8R47DRAFT_1172213 [Mycena vitilis]|nr:hypothetical protein C8R47DRAFT_1172213 [Mycena vitilis]